MGLKILKVGLPSLSQSQSLRVKMTKFMCSLERQFHELFKTHPLFIPSAYFVGVTAV